MKADAHKNVLLLAVSTLPVKSKPLPNVYRYTSEKKEYFFHGISQLESETKLVLTLLAEKQEKLDRIVCLCTDEVLTIGNNEEYDICGLSAMDFFQKRILSYLKTGSSEKECGFFDPFGSYQKLEAERENTLTENKETPLKNNLYQTLPEDFFTIVSMKEMNFFWNAANAIRKDCDEHTPVHLYLNMQGGDRTAVAEMNAIVELMKTRGVNVLGRYVNDYDPSKYLHNIMEVSQNYAKYELAAAMQVFRNYGWGTDLRQYFEKYPINEHSGNKKPMETLLTAIEEISDGIRLCNMAEFDQGIEKIKQIRFVTKQGGSVEQLLFDEIKNDYEELLKDASPDNKIRWCLKKGFLQQALTILESQMPEFLNQFVEITVKEVRSRTNKNNPYEVIDKRRYSVEAILKKRKEKDQQYKWMEDENYRLSVWIYNPLSVLKNGEELFIDFEKDNLGRWNRNREKVLQNIVLFFSKNETVRWEEKDVPDETQYKAVLQFRLKEHTDQRLFGYYAVLHAALKSQRNETNHSLSGKRTSVKQIENALQLYLQVTQELRNSM